MKMKKITALIVSAVAFVASFSTMPSVIVKADGEGTSLTNVQLVQAYDEYANSYIAQRFADEYGIDFDDEKSYSFRYRAEGASDEEWVEVDSTKSGKTTFEIASGRAEMQFYYVETEGETETKVFVEVGGNNTFKFDLINEVSESSLYYANLSADAIKNYNDSIALKYENKVVTDSFYYPSLEDVVVINDNAETDEDETVKADLLISDHFDYSDLTKTLYYARPGSSSFSSTTSSSFTLSGVGTYSFYILAKDPTGNSMSIDTDVYTRKVVGGIDGWYDESDHLYVPIFSFVFENTKNISITVDDATQGFVGLTYKDVDDMITIVGENETTEYKLYYSETNLSVGVENWTSEGVEILKKDAKDITEVEKYEFDASTRYFTPVEKGYYYVMVRAADNTGEDTAVTDVISVQKEFKEVKYETEWLKNNLFSFICLIVAFLLLVAIVFVFFFYHPKEETAEESVEPVSRK